ncbi:MAG: hypothetical protein CSB21_03170 [Deltaproteobacteria bacterium]|nr:MAG: hypothetical protein CSB21_03170 [Deltaproteobacteria bacterium]
MFKNKLSRIQGKIHISIICSILLSSSVFAQETKKVIGAKDIYVIGKKETIKKVTMELSQIPGGTNFVNLETIPTETDTLHSVLSKEPGIIMQEFFGGNDQPRLNIRGSAVQANPVNSGVNLLYDGLSINQADGSFVIGLVNPQQDSAVAVYRGANAMKYGSASLGGAINFIPKTGLNNDSFVDVQFGSHSTKSVNIGVGGIYDKIDYYLSSSFSESDGFRAMSDSERKDAALHIGYTINDNIENTTLFNYSNNFFHIPFVIQKKIASEHPEAIVGDGYAARGGWDGVFNIYKRKPHRDTEQFRIANKTSFITNNNEYNLGIYAQKMDDTFTDPLTHEISENHNLGINLKAKGQDLLLSHDVYELSLVYNKGSMPIEYWVNSGVDGSKVFKYADLERDASNLAVNLQYNVPVTQNIEIVSDLQWIRNIRDISGKASTPKSQGGFDNAIQALDKEYTYNSVNPKLGLIFNPSKDINIYTNISRSVEVPTFNQLINRSVIPLVMPGATMPPFTNPALASGANLVDLDEQRATTYEAGTKGSYDGFSWQASYYYSKVKDELITQVDVSAVNGQTFNYTDETIHQGIELGMNYIILKDIFTANDAMSANLVYNYNDFKFDGGVYDGNQIAGVPKQTIYVELAYKLGETFYIAPNVKIQPDDNYADHSNTIKQDSFTLYGLKLAYKPSSSLSFFADLNNVTDEEYETTFVVRGKSGLASPTFLPGDGFNASIGVKYTW